MGRLGRQLAPAGRNAELKRTLRRWTHPVAPATMVASRIFRGHPMPIVISPRRLLRLLATACLAAATGMPTPSVASEIVDTAIIDMRRLLAEGEASEINAAVIGAVRRVDAEKGRLSPEAVELAERFGHLFFESNEPAAAAALFERAFALNRRLDPRSPRTAQAAFDRARALHRVDAAKGWDEPLAEAFALWRGLDLAAADALEAGFALGRRAVEAGRPREAADLFAAALRLGGGRRDEAAERRASAIVELAERRFVVPATADTPDLAAARAVVLDAWGEAGARAAIAAGRKRLRSTDERPDPATVLAIRRRSAEILARWMPDDLPARRDAARDLGNVAAEAGSFAEAERAWSEAIGFAERLAGAESIPVADLSMEAGEALSDASADPQVQAMAARHFTRTLALREKHLAADDVGIADAALRLYFARHLLRLTGEATLVEDQNRLLRRALDILAAASPPDHRRLSDLHVHLSQAGFLAGDAPGWLSHARIAVTEADLSGDVLSRIVTRMGLVAALPPDADAEIDRRLDEWAALAETRLASEPHWSMGALAARADHELARGRWAAADAAARRAAAIGRGGEAREAVTILEQLARIADFFGRRTDSAELLDHAATIAARKADNVIDRLNATRLEARAAIRRADWAGAEERLAEALAVQDATFGAEDPSNGGLHSLYGFVLRRRGDLAGAEPHLRLALDLQRRDAVADPGATVTLRSDLATLLVERGTHDEAIRLQAENAAALDAGAVVGVSTRIEIAASNAEALLGADRPDEALAAARRAAAIVTARVATEDGTDPRSTTIREAEVRRASDVFRIRVRAAWAVARKPPRP